MPYAIINIEEPHGLLTSSFTICRILCVWRWHRFNSKEFNLFPRVYYDYLAVSMWSVLGQILVTADLFYLSFASFFYKQEVDDVSLVPMEPDSGSNCHYLIQLLHLKKPFLKHAGIYIVGHPPTPLWKLNFHGVLILSSCNRDSGGPQTLYIPWRDSWNWTAINIALTLGVPWPGSPEHSYCSLSSSR